MQSWKQKITVALACAIGLTSIPLGSVGASAQEVLKNTLPRTVGESVATSTTEAVATSTTGVAGLSYKQDSFYDGYTITGCDENLTELNIPAEIDGIAVTTIRYSAFEGMTSLEKVTIPDSVIVIGSGAFRDCSNLKQVTLGESVQWIEYEAFKGCESLTEIEFPWSVQFISNSAFEDCTSLEEVYLPDSVQEIGNGVFENCTALSKVHLPDTMTGIPIGAFSGCTSLEDLDFPEDLESIGTGAFANTGLLKKHTEDYVVFGSVFYAYQGTEKAITLPETVQYLSENAFQVTPVDEDWSSVNVPFEEITLSDRVEKINLSLFEEWYNHPAIVHLGKYTKTIDFWYDDMGNGYWVKEVDAPENSLYLSSDNGILYNKDKTKLLYYPICKEDLTTYTLPTTVTSIGDGAFFFSSLKELKGMSHVTEVGEFAFANSDIVFGDLVLGEGLTELPYEAFCACQIDSVTLPVSLKTIQQRAFGYCESLTDVYYAGTEAQWNQIDLDENENDALLSATMHYSSSGQTFATGDLDGNDVIDTNDAYLCLLAYANLSVGSSSGLTEAQLSAADVNGDGTVDADDAYYMLLVYAKNSVGENATIADVL